MESMLFAIILFCIILISLCWLATPIKEEIIEGAPTTTEAPTEAQATEELITKELVVVTEVEQSTHSTEVLQEEENIALAVVEESVTEPGTLADESTLDESIEEVQNLAKNEHQKIDILALKVYKINKKSCVKVTDLPEWFQVPDDIKLYKSKEKMFIKLQDLERLQ
ncbi:MAG: hypothetical protein KME46_34055 [Brasilonema angustatum HA4187-MV1]|jgi:hypothetical protein|nr:hypothetical protein [Brasilonema angustatum HA4187-MV1]